MLVLGAVSWGGAASPQGRHWSWGQQGPGGGNAGSWGASVQGVVSAPQCAVLGAGWWASPGGRGQSWGLCQLLGVSPGDGVNLGKISSGGQCQSWAGGVSPGSVVSVLEEVHQSWGSIVVLGGVSPGGGLGGRVSSASALLQALKHRGPQQRRLGEEATTPEAPGAAGVK